MVGGYLLQFILNKRWRLFSLIQCDTDIRDFTSVNSLSFTSMDAFKWIFAKVSFS